MGQMRCHLSAEQLQPMVNHYTGQQSLRGQLEVWIPPPPLVLNLRDLQNPQQLSAQQLQIILDSYPEHPNIMLFIHGYNVGLGDAGKILLTQSKTSSTCQQVEYQGLNQKFDTQIDDLYYSEMDATICRLLIHQHQQFGAALHKLKISDDRLNGDGAHNWWRRMEYNLNKAAGFKCFDYLYQPQLPHYTRILNVAWAGDPVSPLDYMAVEPIAEKTATALLTTIYQLIAHDVEINIIAHSAGNIVLIKLMELLGRQSQYHDSLNHVFMWQPAVPDNVLSPYASSQDDSLTSFWQTSHAYLSTRKIHVLYSHHDNILGPIPLKLDGSKDLQLHQKWKTRGGGKAMAITALSLELIDQQLGVPNALKSCYHVAHLFHAPFNALLFNSELRHELYAAWYVKQGSHLDPKAYQSTLSAQVISICHHYHKAFNDIALFISLYSAIIHDGITVFLINMKNDMRLAEFLATLPPRLAEHVIHNVAQAANSVITYDDWFALYNQLNSYAQHYVSFNYLYKLWDVLLNNSMRWIKSGIHEMHSYLQALTHDILLHHPLYFLEKHIEVNCNAWNYLLDQFHHHRATSLLSQREQGYRLATRGSEVAAFVITMLNAPGTEPRPAMGYSGVDQSDKAMQQLIDSGRVNCIDQSEYLWHHSAMKVSNFDDSVFKNVYQKVIMQAEGIHFGGWL